MLTSLECLCEGRGRRNGRSPPCNLYWRTVAADERKKDCQENPPSCRESLVCASGIWRTGGKSKKKTVCETKTDHNTDEGFRFSERARPAGRNDRMNCRGRNKGQETLRLKLNTHTHEGDSLW